MKKIALLFFFLLTNTGFSQLSKTHYIPPITCSNNEFSIAEEQFIYISTPSINPVNFRIIQLGSSTILGTVSRNNPYSFSIGTGTYTQFILDNSLVGSIASDKGFIIEAESVVYVSVRLNGGGSNQAGQITSKGLAALGKEYRVGAFRNNNLQGFGSNNITFASVLATENNTVVTFNNIKNGVTLLNSSTGNTPFSITLNNGQSYVIATSGNTTSANRDGLIGMKISSDKDIVVNCGSTTGSNGSSNTDYGIDQLVSFEKTGKEYIFIKSTGQAVTEVPLLVANKDTKVFLNGNNDNDNPDFLINEGSYLAFNGNDYDENGNLYIRTSENIFAYQCVGDNTRTDFANQNMFFVPPLSCETPKGIDNIPNINKIGSKDFIGRVAITTKTGSILNFIINGTSYTYEELAFAGYTTNGPNTVTGNANYVTYTITGLTGNVAVYSTSELYLASLGSVGAATFGGYYSGFILKPEISFTTINPLLSSCIPNATLSVGTISSFDEFKWYFNGTQIGTGTSIQPNQPGEYYVSATNTACNRTEVSDIIPVSDCTNDYDNDGVNDNIDIDLDNDGIVNCIESNLTPQINLSNTNSGTISVNSSLPIYDTTFTGQITTSFNAVANPIIGNIDGSFSSEVPAGKTSFVSYTLSLTDATKSFPLGFKYCSAGSPNLLNADAEFVIKVPVNKSISVINPDNQLLIDTNYDGNYESGVTQFTAFEIRFRLNGSIPLAAGTGTFTFKTIATNSITIIHKNLSDTNSNKVGFILFSDCIGNSIQTIAIQKKFDLDSDDDGILDFVEAQGTNPIQLSNTDANRDGLDDAFGAGIIPIDSDNDGIPNYIDVDSDNDGIFDIVESGINLTGLNNSLGSFGGTNFGNNGIQNAIETTPDNGIVNYILLDNDNDGIANYIDSDSDGDGCNDVIEAGFTDANNDGYLGNNFPVTINTNGIVLGTANGYTTPNINYSLAAPIFILSQPTNQTTCQLENATFTIATNAVDSYQWQVSNDNGTSWQNITNSLIYSGTATNSLTISKIPANFSNHLYRVFLQKNGNSCGLISNVATINFLSLPNLNSPISIVQCEDDGTVDGFSILNLRQKEDISLSPNALNETFSYYKTQQGAIDADASQLILNPESYDNSLGNTVWIRVVNSNNCYNVAQLNIVVTSSQISNSFSLEFKECDDFISNFSESNDGIATFDFSSAIQAILDELPISNTYFVRFYTNQNDALSELNPIPEVAIPGSNQYGVVSNFRNTTPNLQQIWVRVDNTLSNECFALGPYINLIVTKKPDIKLTDEAIICLNKPFETVTLTAGIQDGSPASNYTYEWFKDSVALNITTSTINITSSGDYKVIVTSLVGCTEERMITVKPSEIATLQTITISDLVNENSIIVNVSGVGDYVYSIDAPNSFQESNQFTNVSSGTHAVYIKDSNGCGLVGPIEITVMSFPKFFTPNGDGFNDTWNISGYNLDINESVIIRIYDRFGKLIKQISPEGMGWNGTFDGTAMPADDYWFIYEFENGRTVKGNFSLKR
jgi:gliding motility-associated-like protein